MLPTSLRELTAREELRLRVRFQELVQKKIISTGHLLVTEQAGLTPSLMSLR